MEEQTVLTTEKLEQVLTEYKDMLLAELPGQIERIILFGSYARGDARPESDVDVMVIVNWPQESSSKGFSPAYYTDPRWRKINDLAADLSLEHGFYISPTILRVEQYNEWEPLVDRVKREGKELWPVNQT